MKVNVTCGELHFSDYSWVNFTPIFWRDLELTYNIELFIHRQLLVLVFIYQIADRAGWDEGPASVSRSDLSFLTR